MRTSTATVVATILPALATIASGATRQARVGKRLRVYRAPAHLPTTGELGDAVRLLLAAGHGVKLYDASGIHTAAIADDGALTWATRATSKERDYSVVEVAL